MSRGGLFYRSGADSDEGVVSFTFRYEGCEVTAEEGVVHVKSI